MRLKVRKLALLSQHIERKLTKDLAIEMNESIDAKDSMALLLTSQEHIHENIKFADQKAIALIGINGALLGVLYPLFYHLQKHLR